MNRQLSRIRSTEQEEPTEGREQRQLSRDAPASCEIVRRQEGRYASERERKKERYCFTAREVAEDKQQLRGRWVERVPGEGKPRNYDERGIGSIERVELGERSGSVARKRPTSGSYQYETDAGQARRSDPSAVRLTRVGLFHAMPTYTGLVTRFERYSNSRLPGAESSGNFH